MPDNGTIKAMKTGVDVEITASVKNARALLTNNMLKVLAST
jgi:hypothetical protein